MIRRYFAALVVAAFAVGPALAGAASNHIFTAAGTGAAGYAGDGGPATGAELHGPVFVRATRDGGYLISDQTNARVRRVSAGGTITTVAGNGTAGFSGDGGPATGAQLHTINDVAELPDGSVLIADSHNNRVRRVGTDGTITTVAGTGAAGPAGDGGAATAAQLNFPVALAVRSDGGFLIADNDNHRVRQVSPGGTITTVAGTGAAGSTGDGAPATAATLASPAGIALTPDGGFLVAEQDGARVRRVAPDGTISTVAGTGAAGSDGDGGPATAARLSTPSGVAVMPDGGFVVSELTGHRVRRVAPDGTIATLAGTGTASSSGDGGPAGAAELNTPIGLSVTAEGDVLIADTGNHRVRGVDTGDAQEPREPEPTPPPAPPGSNEAGPPAPEVVDVSPAGPLRSGQLGFLIASVRGDVARLNWDLDGDGTTEVSCRGDQTGLGMRMPLAGAGVRARASQFGRSIAVTPVSSFGRIGESVQFNPPVLAAPTPRPPALRRVSTDRLIKLTNRKPVRMCTGDRERIGEVFGNRQICLRSSTMVAGGLRVSGCLRPIRDVSDIPAAERGILERLAAAARARATSAAMDAALSLTDGWIANGPVIVNGVEIDPRDGAAVVVHRQIEAIASSNAQISAGGILLDHRKDFELLTKEVRGRIPLGAFRRLEKGLRAIGGLPLVDDISIDVVPGDGPDAYALIKADLALPFPFEFGGKGARGHVEMRLNADGRIQVDGIRIGPIDAGIGALGIRGLKIEFRHGAWTGEGALCVTIACLDARPVAGEVPPAGVEIRDGRLTRLYVRLRFPDPGLTLFPGVQLNHVGAGFEQDPLRIKGDMAVTAAQVFKIRGSMVLGFPTHARPFRVSRQDVVSLPNHLYDRDYHTFTLAFGASGALKVPLVPAEVPLGGAYLLYSAPGYIAFGGFVEYGFFGVVSMSGRVDGEVNFASGLFNVGGHVEGCIADILCRGFTGVISSRGLGGCADFGITDVGGGVIYSPFKVILSPWGCRWSRFREPNVIGTAARAAQVGGPKLRGAHEVTMKAGELGRAVRLDGTDGAPRVRITAPSGATLDSPAGPGVSNGPGLQIIRSESQMATIVAIMKPETGRYRITPLDGSPAVRELTEAQEPPRARVSGRVTGAGARRVLHYDVAPRPDQRVTFVEVGAAGQKVLGTVAGGRGRLRFSPAPGKGRRRIEARFELAGLPAETERVAIFAPPSPRLRPPARLRVSRRGGALRVGWKGVRGATRYEVVVAPAFGGQRRIAIRRPSAVVRRVARGSGGTVTVQAVAEGRRSRPRAARFRAVTRRPTRIRPLPRR